jgi:hypothetical protein
VDKIEKLYKDQKRFNETMNAIMMAAAWTLIGLFLVVGGTVAIGTGLAVLKNLFNYVK